MEINHAIKIISALADGIDPNTGEVFPKNSPYQDPDTLRALFLAIQGLEKMKSKEARSKALPDNAGQSWSREEDLELIDQFKAGASIDELAKLHGRTVGAMRSRLLKLGMLSA